MVKGLQTFREYFKDYNDHYVIIGGTACDMILAETGIDARATKDIDLILVVEALSANFVRRFWEFIKAGKYERSEEGQGEQKHYRFSKPATGSFPSQVELFSKAPEMLTLDNDVPLTPIPVDDDLSGISAIIMNEDYYNFTLASTTEQEGLRRANPDALICLKAFAYVNMLEKKEGGEEIDEKNIRKHKSDVFRLMLLLTADAKFDVPQGIKTDLMKFFDRVQNDLPDSNFFKSIGAGNINSSALLKQFQNNFGLA